MKTQQANKLQRLSRTVQAPVEETLSVKCMCFIWQQWIREPTRRANGGCTDLIGWPGRRSMVAYYALPVRDVKRARLKKLSNMQPYYCGIAMPIFQNNMLADKQIKTNNS